MTEKTQGAKVSRVYRTKGPPKGNGVSETKAAFNYRSILGYCLGAIGGVCSYNFLSNYGNFYFTDVLKIANSAVVVIMLVVRIFDAAFAPVMGVMIDKFTSRWGRMRHWWLIGSIAVPAFFLLLLMPLPISGITRILFYTIIYLLWNAAYTMVSIPEQLFPNVISRSNQERMKFISVKSVCSSLTGAVLNSVAMPMILFFGSGEASSARGFFLVGLVLSAVIVTGLFLGFLNIREVGVCEAEEKVSLRESLRVAMTSRNLMIFTIALSLFLGIYIGRMSMVAYYCIYNLGSAGSVSMMVAAMSVGSFFPALFVPILCRWVSKRTLAALSTIGVGVSCLMVAVGNFYMAVAGMLLYGLFNWFPILSYGMICELLDEMEVKTHSRPIGIAGSFISMANKIAAAAGCAIFLALLGLSGYAAGETQSAETLRNMNLVINILPAAGMVLACILCMRVKLTNKDARRNEDTLMRRE